MGKMVIFSAVRGQVLLNGAPVVGATVVREFDWAWKSEKGRDTALTDGQGRFAMDTITRSSFLGSLLPHEPVVRQTITIEHAGKRYMAWATYKHDYDENGELDGKPINVTCRLDAEPQRRGEVFGLCELH